jgi:adhesin transport system outer membrane protein
MMLPKKRTLAILVAAMAPWAVQAQADAPASTPAPAAADLTSLDKVVAYSLIHNPEVRARYQDFNASVEGQKVTRGPMLPQLNANGWVSKEFRGHIQGGPDYSYGRTGYALELRQLLFDGFSTYNAYRQAGYTKLSSFFELMATSDNTAYTAVQAYLDVERYRELEKLARENYDLHDETYKLIQQRTTSGVGRGADLEQAASRLALAQTNLMTESANLNDVTSRYTRVVTVGPAATLADVAEPSGQLPAKPTSFVDSLRINPSILAKQANVLAANKGVDAAKGAFAPIIEAVASTGRDRSDPNLVSPAFQRMQSSSLGIQARWNLYRGSADIARVRQTTAQRYAADDLRDFACRNVQQDLSTAWNNIANLRAQIPYLREHAVSTAKVRDAYRQQFRIGQRTLLDLLNTENERFEAARALANAQYDMKLAQFRWLALSHKILPTLGLAQLESSEDLPKEASDLSLSDEALQACATAVPDTSRLAPILSYGEGDKPPSMVPTSGGAKKAPARTPASALPAGKW